MKRVNLFTALSLFAFASGPAVAYADHHEAGGKSAEKRSEKAAEKSNAQWSDDAVKGADRATEQKPATDTAPGDAQTGKPKKDQPKKDADADTD
jgi:hypothetical protein